MLERIGKYCCGDEGKKIEREEMDRTCYMYEREIDSYIILDGET
jgi:hypothetical protein